MTFDVHAPTPQRDRLGVLVSTHLGTFGRVTVVYADSDGQVRMADSEDILLIPRTST